MELEVLELGGEPLAARIARFPDFSFTHARLPRSSQLWRRGPGTGSRVTLLVQLQGCTEIDGAGGGSVEAPAALLVPAGTDPMLLRTTAERNEVICVRLNPELFLDHLPLPGELTPRPVDVKALRPLLAFITNICAAQDLQPQLARAMAPAAEQVVRSLLLAAAGEGRAPEPLFLRARRYILQHFTDPALRVEHVALQLGVAVRTVQAELQQGDTSFSRLLLEARIQAALRTLAEQPGIARADLAHRSGFGSVSSLQRALSGRERLNPPA